MKITPPKPPTARAAVLFAALLVTGCQSARVADPLTRTVGGNDPEQQVEFWHQLADRPVTSNDEAFHALLLFTDANDPATDYPGRVAALKQKRLLGDGFDQPAEQAIDRGTLAVALAKVLDIRGGVLMRLTGAVGPSPRYAVRELQFLNVFPPSSPNQTFSGSEFLGIMAKAEEYQKTGTRGSQTVDAAAEERAGDLPADLGAPEAGPTTAPAGAPQDVTPAQPQIPQQPEPPGAR